MKRPPRIPPPSAQSVPIIGMKKFNEKITFEVAGFKFHPPIPYDQVYVMMIAVVAMQQPNYLKVMHAFSASFQLYLAEDCELGKKHDIVMMGSDVDGQLTFQVAKPVKDEPAKKDKKPN